MIVTTAQYYGIKPKKTVLFTVSFHTVSVSETISSNDGLFIIDQIMASTGVIQEYM
ncbi:hypothetical protein SEEN2570_08449 [Salmonella enterica subsp. enterica serovar Newport str. VA_R100512570]|nr:hypothetical protein SEEN2570_08449 [Salmonella enterica subsp. enterica serovar Newport str. VA_R100512570]KJT68963.1 hypothetical protein SEEH3714_12696 [Salmonella enterica subsp. enterica serovar Heidelberg str. 622737-14]